MSLYNDLVKLITLPANTRWIAPCLILAETVLCALIIWKVPYTEIDWETYMIQVSKFLPPEPQYNYAHIDGPTGPLVYPAIHVYIHSALYYITDHGRNIELAQMIYAGLYIITLAIVIACYRRINAPPWLLVLLVLSKRMHSIFLLRMFNDAWATLFFWLTVYAAQRRHWTYATMLWSAGLGIKMTLLLALPGLSVVVVQGSNMEGAIFAMGFAFIAQVCFAYPFWGIDEGREYVMRAFDLSRQFLYKWTVNWRFVEEDVFLSKEFAYSLLLLHVTLLIVFLHYKWVRPTSTGLIDFCKKYINYLSLSEEDEIRLSNKITPTVVMDTLLGSMVIGLLCARSLHYQFYAYLGWMTPYLLWRLGISPAFVVISWAMQEYAWLTFPSTNLSSTEVVWSLALQVLCVFLAPPVDHITPPRSTTKKTK